MEASQSQHWLSTYRSAALQTGKLFSPVEHRSSLRVLGDTSSSMGAAASGKTSAQQKDGGSPPATVEMKVGIQNKALWKSFMKIGNEMIVTKPGRCLFPTLLVSLRGLEPKKQYQVSLRMVAEDNYRYRYTNTTWSPAGESDVIQNQQRQIFHHPCSPTSGAFWMKRPISFKSVKITHYSNSKNGNILLHTMHKYVMEVIVTPQDGSPPTSILLPETTFVAVSAYQNSEVIQLKIDNNPFAKAFKYQDKAAILEHFSEAFSPKRTALQQADRQLGQVPFQPQLTNTPHASSSSSVSSPLLCTSPLLLNRPPNNPVLQATPFPSLSPRETLLRAGALPLYPLLPSQMIAGFLPLASPLMSPYLLLMLCNQLCNKQTPINGGQVTGIDEASNLTKNDDGVLLC